MADSNNQVMSKNVGEKYDFGNVQSTLPDLTGKKDEEIATSMWGLQPQLIKEITNMNRVYASKHGMFMSTPIICRGADCAYKDVCMVTPQQRIVGHRCPMEIAAILSRYEQWCAHFEIDTSQNMINSADLVDATLIKDLVNIEVQMMRAENKVALNGDFMADTLLDIDKKCNPYFGKIVSPEMEFLMTLQDKKIKVLNQLNATRKDKAADKRTQNGSDTAIRIFQQVKEMAMEQHKNISISDLEFNDDGEIVDADITEIVQGGEVDGNGNENPQRGGERSEESGDGSDGIKDDRAGRSDGASGPEAAQ